MKDKIELTYVAIQDIVPYENNPRKNDKAVPIVMKSISENGFLVPIILDDKNIIVCGHTRLKAAIKLGLSEVPVIYAEGLTDAQIKAFRIMDNKSSEYATWDMDLLKSEMIDLRGLDYSLDLTGFSEVELNKLVPEEVIETIDISKEPKYKVNKGDIWVLGNHRLMCGDSTNKANVEALCSENGVRLGGDMVFTDPPYNVDYSGMQNSKQWDLIKNDSMSDEKFQEFLYNVFMNMYEFTKDTASAYICHADKSHIEFRKAFEKVGYDWRATIIWEKNSPAFNFAQYKYKHEPIFYCYKRGKVVNWYGDNTQNTIWHANKEKGDHPTIKPVELILNAIINSSKQGDIVLDFFGGSGSTLIACEKSNRRCFMIELDEKYCSVIIERWEKLTGKKACQK